MNSILDLLPILVGVLTGILGALAAFYFNRIKNSLPRAYNIAVIGFPKSGKTTLITSLFSQLLYQKVFKIVINPRGSETIERLNSNIEKLEIGRSLGPTTDQDLFAYRADIITEGIPFKKTIKVQIGDFPGEDTQEFAEKFGDWFHTTPYFKWVMEADAFLFIVDIARVLSDTPAQEYRASISRAIRAAWQHIQEYHIEGNKVLRYKPIALVFTKSDLLFNENIRSKINNDNMVIVEEILKLGFGDKLPPVISTDPENIKSAIETVLFNFRDIDTYLKSQSKHYTKVFVSHFVLIENERLGIAKLVKFILPR